MSATAPPPRAPGTATSDDECIAALQEVAIALDTHRLSCPAYEAWRAERPAHAESPA
jgi:hypothetical protein